MGVEKREREREMEVGEKPERKQMRISREEMKGEATRPGEDGRAHIGGKVMRMDS